MIKDLYQIVTPAENGFKVEIDRIFNCIDTLYENQQYYQKTRGSHAAIIFDDAEKWARIFEDTTRNEWQKPEEVIEAIRYLEDPNFYTKTEEPVNGNIWLGAADDVIFRKRGVEFVDGTAPGFAACLGAPPSKEIAEKIAQELLEKTLYVFMHSDTNGVRMAEQLKELGVQIGWPTRLIPFGPTTSSVVFAIGFACRVAMAFGGIKPGDYLRNLLYNKDRTFAFVVAFGPVSDEWYANAAGAINWGFPTISDWEIPEIKPFGVCTYEHVVSKVPYEEIVERALEVRGLDNGALLAVDVAELVLGPAHAHEALGRQEAEYLFLEGLVVDHRVGGLAVGEDKGQVHHLHLGHVVAQHRRGDGRDFQGSGLHLFGHGALGAQLTHGESLDLDLAAGLVLDIGGEGVHALALAVEGRGHVAELDLHLGGSQARRSGQGQARRRQDHYRFTHLSVLPSLYSAPPKRRA
jgi:hypothetical protein